MKGRISILFVPLVVFLAFAAMMWALRVNTLAQDREDMFLQASGHASRLASRLARIAEVNLVDHVGKLEEHVMFASIEMNSSSVVVLDPEGRSEIGAEVLPVDSLKFKDSKKYPERLMAAHQDSGESDSLVAMQGTVKGIPLVAAVFEFDFMGGSMGSVLGERFVRGVNAAVEQQIPFVCVTASGGARMQEGLFSLMQMAKTTASISELARHGLPFITVLTDPTMGGVSASFAFVGDVVIAEPNALVGFAGPRVIEQTVREKLPEGFQRAEFLLEKGAIDMIVHRKNLRDELSSLLRLLRKEPVCS